MAAPTLNDLLVLYARRGIADWKNAPSELRKRASKHLANKIADSEPLAQIIINKRFNGQNGGELQFIPMPAHGKNGIDRSFFLPIQEVQQDGSTVFSFDLFLLLSKGDCLAFRFEMGEATGNHTYTHVQFCRALVRNSLHIEAIPKWIPDSYPAFPLHAASPMALFLTMAVTVHGYLDGLAVVLQDIFSTANRSNDFKGYASELKTALNC
jgi:hypothetical protein